MSLIQNINFLRFKSSRKLSFPAGDVLHHSAETGEVELGFMGLTGVDSPLPYYIKPSPHLDIINHRLYVLFYRAIRKSSAISIKSIFCETRENTQKEINSYFGDIPVSITEFIPRWKKLDCNSQTVGDMILGERVLVSSFSVKIPRYADHVVIGQWTVH